MRLVSGQKVIPAILIIFLVVGMFLPINKSRAFGFEIVEDPINLVVNAISAAAESISSVEVSSITVKEYVLDPLANLAAQTVIRAITSQILGWIQGGDTNFVSNIDREFQSAADAAAGEFLNSLTGLNLCGNIGAFLQITLQTPGFRQRIECTLTDIIANVNNFYKNFEQGGWESFIRISLQPQNNPYGAYLIALDAKIEAENRARQRVGLDYQTGKGFLGFRVPVGENCDTRPASGANPTGENEGANPTGGGGAGFTVKPQQNKTGENRGLATIGSPLNRSGVQIAQETTGVQKDVQYIPAQQVQETASIQPYEQQKAGDHAFSANPNRETFCETAYEVKTPGGVIADGLSKSLYSGLDSALLADEINEGIAAIVTALLNKIISASSGGGSGIFDSTITQLPPPSTLAPATTVANSFFSSKIDDPALRIQSAQSLIDATIAGLDTQIFPIRLQISQLQSACGSTTCDQTQIDSLTAQKAPLEDQRNLELTKLANLDKAYSDLMQFRNSLTQTTDPALISSLNTQLTALLINVEKTIQAAGSPSPSPISQNPVDNVVLMSQKSGQHAASAILLLNQKITQLSTSSVTTLTIEMQSLKNVFIQKKDALQKMLDDLTLLRLQVLATKDPTQITVLSAAIVTKITAINISVTEAYKL